MEEALTRAKAFLIEKLPGLLIPIAMLVVGWVLALIFSWFVAKAVGRMGVGRWLASKILGRGTGDVDIHVER